MFNLLLSQTLYPQQKYNLNGLVKSANENVADCEITVFFNNELFSAQKSLANGYFFLELSYNKSYFIKFKKAGVKTLIIKVSTFVPAGFEDKHTKSNIFTVDINSQTEKQKIKNYRIDPKTGNLLELTQEYIDDILEKAKKKGERIISNAEQYADSILKNAEILSDNIKNRNKKGANDNKNVINELQNEIYLLKQQKKLNRIINPAINNDSIIELDKLIQIKKDKILILYKDLDKAILNNDSTKILLLQAEIENLKPEIESLQAKTKNYKIQLEINELKIRKKNAYIYIAVTVVIFVLIMLFIALLLYKNKRKTASLLSQKNLILSKQKEKIEKQHNNITSSIKYASIIQNSFLSIEKSIKDTLDYFVYYKPKDIVSGDFYWFEKIAGFDPKIESSTFAAAFDCTGHGVPGAFMSMLGNSLLNEIVTENKIYDPAKVLTLMNEGVVSRLNQTKTKNTDGMDACLCRFDKYYDGKIQVCFTGAQRPLFYYDSNKKQIIRIKGNRLSIGGLIWKKDKFITKTISCNSDDVFYLTSDGYIDQKGSNGKRYGTQNFMSLLKTTATKPIDKQESVFEKEIINFKGNFEYRDDISVIGVKFQNS